MALISYSCSEGGGRPVSSARFTCGGVGDVRAESDTGFRAWSSSVVARVRAELRVTYGSEYGARF